MADIRHTWPPDAFDAIAILAMAGEFEVEGTDRHEVILEGVVESGSQSDLDIRQVGHWLRVQPSGRLGEVDLRLRLPRQQAWVVEIAAARGGVEVRGIHARLQVALGKGDVEVRDSRGTFAVKAGKGDVRLENCSEAEVPERPAVPCPEMAGAGPAEEPARTWRQPPPPPPPPPFARGRKPDDFAPPCGSGRPWADWAQEWVGSMPWQEWRGWVQDWLVNAPWGEWIGVAWGEWGHLLAADDQALSLYLGRGNIKLAEVGVNSCRAWIGKGDFRLDSGQVGQFQVRLANGDVACRASPLPAAAWSIDTRHGDVELELAADTSARLDVATRHGAIRSDFPLVRVGRPGPEARHGGRMVGTLGAGETPAQINLSTLHGDVVIRRAARGEWPQEGRQAGRAPEGVEGQVPAAEATPPRSESRTDEMGESGARPAEAASPEPAPPGHGEAASPAGDARPAILESLSRGEITVEEASRLLDGLL